ncbi:hypothetical protein TSUD_78300 [Trifolium subterraneum]|uniref:HAT C-terminal dimerisation domain-containing protein n=1 Tax=Trifolium subterraneum TaxID=3900 RepID=A0A2Z6MU93_TRISU|nr:hypothetical protein TSUD_78300 [Trifolium subterraneum]
MDFINESCGAENECRVLQTCNSAYSEPPKKKLRRFNVWNYFVVIDKNGKEMCECMTCGRVFTCGGRSGISHLNQHILVCPLVMKSRIAEDFKLKKIDHVMVRESITQMTIKNYLPFRFVEWDKFRAFTKFVSHNEAEFLSRDIVVADVMKVYLLEKDKLKKQLASIEGRVCLSLHCWTSSTSSSRYITLTAHFMDDKWNLIAKLLNCCHLDTPRDNFELSRKVYGYLQEWGIERNVYSITVDNASTNDDLQNLKNQLCSLDGLLSNGNYFHLKCCARVLDLMVEESLKVVSDVLDKIRKSLKYVSVSNSRLKQFYKCVEEVGGGDGSDVLHLDVSGKWVSTYTMLNSAMKYRSAFEHMCLKDTTYSHCPSSEEWERGEQICKFLEIFYGLTTIISRCTYPTSGTHLGHDTEIVKDKVSSVRKAIHALFDEYADKSASTSSSLSVLDPHSCSSTEESDQDLSFEEYEEKLEKQRHEKYIDGLTQLDHYLKETDIYYKNPLEYWNHSGHKYGILERMARDVLSIPIITVASESAFSPGSCILNKYRSCMSSENLQALVCSHNCYINLGHYIITQINLEM